jgi:hypothetical protein
MGRFMLATAIRLAFAGLIAVPVQLAAWLAHRYWWHAVPEMNYAVACALVSLAGLVWFLARACALSLEEAAR